MVDWLRRAISVLVGACCIVTAAAGQQEQPNFMAVGLPQWFEVDLGATSAAPPADLPDEALDPPGPPQAPLPLGGLGPGAEWYISALGIVRGPMDAGRARDYYRELATPADFQVWRPGKGQWLAADEAQWLTGGDDPTPIPELFVQSLPPTIPADANKVWFIRPWNLVEWSGPYAADEVGLEQFRFKIWGPQTGWWTSINENADNAAGGPINPNKPFPVLDVEPPGRGLATTPDSARVAKVTARLRGHWVMQGPLVDDIMSDAIQLVFDEEGGIALRLTGITASGSIIGGDGWWSGRYRVYPITDDTALVSASFTGSWLRYGVPVVLKFTVLTDDTMRDDWSGLTLTRRDILPD